MPIEETTFGPQQYLVLRKAIDTSQITDSSMYDEAGKKLRYYAERNDILLLPGWAVLYFMWDEDSKKAEIGIAIPAEGEKVIYDPEMRLMRIPKTKATMAVLRGPYSGLGSTHRALMSYVSGNRLNTTGVPVVAIEEYVVDLASDPDPQHFVTNVYYLHN